MVVTFENKEQLEYISNFVNLVLDARTKSSINVLESLVNKLIGLRAVLISNPDTKLSVDLPEDPTDKYNSDMPYCLYNMCSVLNSIGADEVNAGINIYSMLKNKYAVSDVPRFLEMLNQYKVPAEYCFDLFSDWCSSEGKAVLAEDCMTIQAKHNITMTPVWNWVYANEPSPGIEWTKETVKYKVAING